MFKPSVLVYVLKDNLCKIQQKDVKLSVQQDLLNQPLVIVYKDVLEIHKHMDIIRFAIIDV